MGRNVPPRASDSQRSGSRGTVHQTGEARMFAKLDAVLADAFHVVGHLVEFVQLVLVEIVILIVVVVVIVIRAVYFFS